MTHIFLLFIIIFQIINISSNDNLINIVESFLKETDYSNLQEIIEQYKDQIAVSVVPLRGNHTPYYFNESGVFVSASMIKLLVLCEFIEQIDNQNISLENKYTYKEEDYVGGAGVIQYADFGTIYTYDTLAYFMIKYSDNIATNVLIDILGMENINKKSKSLGLKSTVLNRKMMKEGEQNYMSAEDIEIILKGILYNKIGSNSMCQKAMRYLFESDDNNGIVRGLPNGTNCAHKTGSLAKIRHDGGIVVIDDPYIIIVLTKDFLIENDANYLIGNISAIVYDIMIHPPSPEPYYPPENNNYINYSLLTFLSLLLFFI